MKRQSKSLHKYGRLIALLLMSAMVLSCVISVPLPVYAYVDAIGNVTNVSVNGDVLTLTVDNGLEAGDDI